MKVVILTTSYPLQSGDSTGIFVSGLAERLAKKGHQISVIAPHTKGVKKNEKMAGVYIQRFRYAPTNLEQVAYGYGVLGNIKRKVSAKIFLPLFVGSFFWSGLKNTKTANIIHANWTFAGLVAIWIKKYRKIPVVLTVHGSDLAKLPSFLNRYIINRIDHLIAVSDSLAKEALDLGLDRNKLTVIPNGINNLESLTTVPISKTANNNILWVGRLSEEKNLELLIKSFQKVHQKIPVSSLYIVGDGPLKENLKKLAIELKLSENIFFVGKKSTKELLDYYAKTDLFVFPSLREGFGLSLAEAMAAGLATISSGKGGTRDIAQGRHAVICEYNSPDKLSAAIIRIMQDNNERLKLSELGRSFVKENFGYNNIVQKTEGVYQTVTEKRILFVTRPICPPWDEASKNQAFEISQHVKTKKITLLTAKGFTVPSSHLHFENIYKNAALLNSERLRLIIYLLRHKREYDIFHLFLTPTVVNTLLFRKILNGKRVIQSVPCLPTKNRDSRFLFFGSSIVTISQTTKKIIETITNKEVFQINPGVNLNKYTPVKKGRVVDAKIPSGKFIVLYPGEYKRLKATETILKLVEKSSNDVLTIFACRIKVPEDRIIKNQIIDQLKTAKLFNKVLFLDTVEDMPSLIGASDVVVLPSLDLTGKFDYPLVILESLASGKPTFVADIAPLDEITKYPGIIGVKPSKISDMYDLIDRIKSNKEEYAKISRGARETAMRLFDIKDTAKKYEEIYSRYE